MMLKVLLLQSWYGLRAPTLEKQLARNLLFLRFVQLALSEGVPYHSSLRRFRNLLVKKGICNRVLERAYRNKLLTDAQKQKNRANSGTHSIVERVFRVLKLHYGMGKVRYLGIARNKARLALMCLVYNIKQVVAIERCCQISPQGSTV